MRSPSLWYDETLNKVFRYGGWPYRTTNATPDMRTDLWSFQPGGRTIYWSREKNPAENGLSIGSSAPYGAAWTASDSVFYSLGGSINASLPSVLVKDFVQYDASTGTWSNTKTSIPGNSGFISQAQAVIAPNFGKQGYIVIVGGVNPPQKNNEFGSGTFLMNMSNVILYDVDSKTWYVQKATGDIPPPRTEFCVVGSASADRKTYEL